MSEERLTAVREERVNAIWKYVAMVVVGILVGGAPAYVSLAIDAHAAVTRKDVDTEIGNLNAPIITELSNLKEQVKGLAAEIHELRQLK